MECLPSIYGGKDIQVKLTWYAMHAHAATLD